MTESPRDDGPGADQRLAAALFDPASRGDPYPIYRGVEIPGCRHAAADAILKDARLVPPPRPGPAGDPLWLCFARWLTATSAETMCAPTNPVPPVTKIFTGAVSRFAGRAGGHPRTVPFA